MNNATAIPATRTENKKMMTILTMVIVVAANFLDGVIPPAGVPAAILAIWLILRWTGGTWAELGLRRPESWPRTIGLGVGLGVALQMVATYGLAPLLEALGAKHDPSQFEPLIGNNQMLVTYLVVAWTTAGFGEELIWRGFMMTRLESLFGGNRTARVIAVLITAALFGIIHLRQGMLGVVAVAFVAIVFGTVFFASRRNLWMVFFAHGTADTIAFIYIYNGWGI